MGIPLKIKTLLLISFISCRVLTAQIADIHQAVTGIDTGMVAFYTFNGNTKDYSGKGHHLSVKGSEVYVADRTNKQGNAFNFRSKSYLQLADSTLLNASPGFSISLWAFNTSRSGLDDRCLLSKQNSDSTRQGYNLYLAQNNIVGLSANFCENEFADKYISERDNGMYEFYNTWTNIVAVWDSLGNIRLYHNGALSNFALAKQGTANTYNVANKARFTLGGQSGNYGKEVSTTFFGYMDDVRMYNRTLSQEEVRNLAFDKPFPLKLHLLNDNICKYDSAVVQITNGQAGIKYSMTDMNDQPIGQPTISHGLDTLHLSILNVLKNIKLKIIATDTASGTTKTLDTTLTVNVTAPMPQLGTDTTLCFLDSTVLAPGSFRRYLWQDSSNNRQLWVKEAGTFWVQVTDGKGCIERDTIVVNTTPALWGNFVDTVKATCRDIANGGITIAGTGGTPPYNFRWEQEPNNSAPTAKALLGKQLATITLSDANGCDTSLHYLVPVEPPSEPAFEVAYSDTNACSYNTAGEPLLITLQNQSNNAVSYLWDVEGLANNWQQTKQNKTLSFGFKQQKDSLLDIKLITQSKFGCKDTFVFTDEIRVRFSPAPQFTTLPADTIVFPETTFDFVNTNVSDSPQVSYSWAHNTTPISARPNASYDFTKAGTFPVSLTMRNMQCVDTLTQHVTVLPVPFARIDSLGPGCPPYDTVLMNTSMYADTFIWRIYNEGASTDTTFMLTPADTTRHCYYNFKEPGTWTVWLKAMGHGKPDTTSTQVYVQKPPRVQWQMDPDTIQRYTQGLPDNQPLKLDNFSYDSDAINQGDAIFENFDFLWDFGDGATATFSSGLHYYNDTGWYNVWLYVDDLNTGCRDSAGNDSVYVINPGKLRFPNAFIPYQTKPETNTYPLNSANIHIFHPFWYDNYTQTTSNDAYKHIRHYSLTIISRWQTLIFHTNNVLEGWDGYQGNHVCPTDVYIYRVEGVYTHGDSFMQTGNITLIK